jgi:hypothetical protein
VYELRYLLTLISSPRSFSAIGLDIRSAWSSQFLASKKETCPFSTWGGGVEGERRARQLAKFYCPIVCQLRVSWNPREVSPPFPLQELQYSRRCARLFNCTSISTACPNLIKSNPKRPVGFFQPRRESKPCFGLDPTRIQSKTLSFGWIRSVLDPDPTAFYDK